LEIGNRLGFSLIEITLVMLIMAIVAAAVTLRAQGPMQSAKMDEVAAMIGDFDRLTRVYARRHDRPVLLVVDLSTGRLSRTARDGAYSSGEDIGEPLELPQGYTIDALMVRRQDIRAGSASIAFGRRGLSATYAILLVGPGGRSQDPTQKRWLCVTGLGGQVLEMAESDEEQLRDLLAATAPRRKGG